MDRKEQLKICKSCIHKKNDFKKGIVCNITNDIPNFYIDCKDYSLNQDFIFEEEKKKIEKANSSKQNTVILLAVLFFILTFLIQATIMYFKEIDNKRYLFSFLIIALFDFLIVNAYFKLNYFYIKFHKAINLFGEKTTQRIIIILSIILLLASYIFYIIH